PRQCPAAAARRRIRCAWARLRRACRAFSFSWHVPSNSVAYREAQGAAQPVPCPGDLRTLVTDQPEAQVLRRCADSASAALPVTDEVRHVGAVPSFEHVHSAIAGDAFDRTVDVYRGPRVAGRRPFPDIAAEILDAARVRAV